MSVKRYIVLLLALSVVLVLTMLARFYSSAGWHALPLGMLAGLFVVGWYLNPRKSA